MKFGMKFTSHINYKRPDKILTALYRAVDFGAKRIERRAKYLCPVDTGKLERSIKIEDIVGGKSIGPDTDYDVYVEYGTSKMAAQPYMRPALTENRKPIANRLTKYIKEVLR